MYWKPFNFLSLLCSLVLFSTFSSDLSDTNLLQSTALNSNSRLQIGSENQPINHQNTKNKIQDSLHSIFIAQGNKPYWNLKMELNGHISLNVAGDSELSFTTILLRKSIPPESNMATSYFGESSEGSIKFEITQQTCLDPGFSQEYDFHVSVSAKSTSMKDYKTFEGCGKYLDDYRINDIWALKEIDGKPISPSLEVPYIEFNISANQLLGFGGCNHFNGLFTFQEGKIHFSPLASTLMICPNMEVEDLLKRRLSEGTFYYKIHSRSLLLSNAMGSLTFLKVD